MKNHKYPILILLILVVAHVALTYSLILTNFYDLKISGADGKEFEQALYNLISGRGLNISMSPNYLIRAWLGIHFSPILYAIAPIYFLFPHLQTLLFIQSFMIAIAALPIFYTCRIIFGSQWQALVISIFYLICPFVVNAAIWDFHEIAFAPFILSFIIWSVVTGKKIWLLFFCTILLTIKEHYGLAVFGTGLLWAWHWRDPKFGLMLSAIGLISFITVIKVIMPHFSPDLAAGIMTGNPEIDRFSWLARPFQNMDLFTKRISDAIFYIILLMFYTLMQPVFSFVWLLPALADAPINALANEDMMHHPSSYHSAALIPILLIAYSQTVARNYNATTNLKRWEMLGASALIILVFSYNFVSLPDFPNNIWELSTPHFDLTQKDKTAHDKIIKIIGENAAVSVQNNILPQIPVREHMYMYPHGMEMVEYVILNTTTPFTKKSNVFGNPYFSRNTDIYFNKFYELLDNKDFGIVFYQDNWLLFKRGAKSNAGLMAQVKEDLDKLHLKIEELDKRKIIITTLSHQQ